MGVNVRGAKRADRRETTPGMRVFCCGWLFAAVISGAAYAQPATTSTELIANAASHDGRSIVFKGEAIGDIMVRTDGSWVNVNDGQNAIGIFFPSQVRGAIALTGSYKTIGDLVEVTGTFHRACSQHGGDLDIHAEAVRVIAPGRVHAERFNPAKVHLTLILSGVALVLWIVTKLKIR